MQLYANADYLAGCGLDRNVVKNASIGGSLTLRVENLSGRMLDSESQATVNARAATWMEPSQAEGEKKWTESTVKLVNVRRATCS